MFVDIVFPNRNEKRFLEIAKKLGYDGICFVYEFKEKQDFSESEKKKKQLQKRTDLDIYIGLLAKAKQVSKSKRVADLVLVKSSKDNRYILEKTNADILFGLELNPKPDSMHYRNSGLNQVLCKLANKNRIIVGIPFSMILRSKDTSKSLFIGRISQNIVFCRKYKVDMIIASFAQKPFQMRSARDLASFCVLLGMHPKEAKEATTRLGKRLEINTKTKNRQIIAEGIEIID